MTFLVETIPSTGEGVLICESLDKQDSSLQEAQIIVPALVTHIGTNPGSNTHGLPLSRSLGSHNLSNVATMRSLALCP